MQILKYKNYYCYNENDLIPPFLSKPIGNLTKPSPVAISHKFATLT